MGAAKKILDEIKAGVSPEELARKIAWKDLSGDDGNDLLAVALRLGDNLQSYNLLVYLFHISFSKDLWFSTEVLSQAVQHPNMTLLDRQAILPTMRGRLDQIKDQIATKTPTEEKLNKYWLMEATYYSVNGNLLSETGKRVEATHSYQIAQSIFEQLGQFQKAAEYKSLNRRLLSKDSFKSPLPKTTPIRLNLAPTRPISPQPGPGDVTPAAEAIRPPVSAAATAVPASSDAPAPAEALKSTTAAQPQDPTPPARPETGVPPLIDEKTPAVTQPEALITAPPPLTGAVVSGESTRSENEPLAAATPAQTVSELPAARPSAGAAVNTLVMSPGPKKMAEVAPDVPQPGQVEEKIVQVPETAQAEEKEDRAQEAEQPVQTAPLPPEASEASSAPGVPPGAQPPSPSVTGIYYPLPDVWLEDGRLHILGVEHFQGDESADLTDQIRQQCDILIGIQLQIKMYQTRRRMLDQEMKTMELKANLLRSRIQKLESQLVKLEDNEGVPPA